MDNDKSQLRRELPQHVVGTYRMLHSWLGLAGLAFPQRVLHGGRELLQTDNDKLQLRRELLQHVVGTYRMLRWGLGLAGIVFPIWLWFVGRFWYGIPLQDSMSAYYHARPEDNLPTFRNWLASIHIGLVEDLLFFLGQAESTTPMRSWFVGFLFVIGVSLVLYMGASTLENVLLNLAGIFAVGVTIFPSGYNCSVACRDLTLHAIFASLTFVFTGFVAIVCHRKTLKYISDDGTKRRYQILYWVTGILMIAAAPGAFVAAKKFGYTDQTIFFVELAGTWAFAAYWIVKSIELFGSVSEKLLLLPLIAEELPPIAEEPSPAPGSTAGAPADSAYQAVETPLAEDQVLPPAP
jgi:hypothetical protein